MVQRRWCLLRMLVRTIQKPTECLLTTCGHDRQIRRRIDKMRRSSMVKTRFDSFQFPFKKGGTKGALVNVFLLFCSVALLLFCTAALSEAFKLPDTGQTKCYSPDVSPYDEIPCTGTGQDGEYSINPMSYTDNGDGTITDNNTGLMWQKCSVGQNNDTTCSGTVGGYSWYEATGTYDRTWNPNSENVCGNLTLGGYSDWRLPAKKELRDIVDYSIPYFGPTINTTYFPNTYWSFYWSSTTYAYDPDDAWDVNFDSGSDSRALKAGGYSIRCVRGEEQESSFVDNDNGTVTDNKTGLVWQQGEPGPMSWDSALSYCEGLSLGGNSDWRLPNIKELASLTDDTRYNPAIDTTFFPGVYASYYWSSTTDAYNWYGAWYVNLYYDNLYWGGGSSVLSDDKPNNYYVRCVRSGQSGSSITLTLTPPSNTTVSKGSKLGPFSISLKNNTSSSSTFYAYIYLYTPDGNWRTLMSKQMTLSGGKTLSANNLYMNIPSTAPAGAYSYYVNVYDTSYNLIAQEGFGFNVTSSSSKSGRNYDWEISGWPAN